MSKRAMLLVNVAILVIVLMAIFNMQKIKGLFWAGQYAEVRLKGCDSEECELRGTLKISVRSGDYYLVDEAGREIFFDNKSLKLARFKSR